MLALTVALVAPYFVDWTSYRADFEREATRILGREVTVRGDASARILPFPSVTFTDVAVAGNAPDDPVVTVETFSMDLELAPFMRGDLHIFDMRLVRPSVVIGIGEDGTLDWAMQPSVPVGANHVSLEKLTVTEGRVAVRHGPSGRTHNLTEVNADISARALTGPWRLDGSLRLDGLRSVVSVSTGVIDDTGGIRLRLRVQPERYAMVLESDGNARIENGHARYSGQFKLTASSGNDRLRAGDGSTFALAAPEAAPVRAAPPAYRVSGAFQIDHDAINVPEFRFETGTLDDPYTADGTAELAIGVEPRFLIRADGAQIRFGDAEGAAGQGATLDARIAALREFVLDMPRPTIPGRIEMRLPAIVAGDTTIRDVNLFAEPRDNGWTLASLGATLPGRATLEARGDLDVANDLLGFKGSLLLAVAQPSGFAAWLSRDVDDAIRRLPAAGFSADVELTEARQIFRNLELRLGSATFNGEIENSSPADANPAMSLRLHGNSLDVEGMSAFASLFVSGQGEARLADRDLDFAITAGPVSAAGLTAERLDTALRLKAGRLEIDRLTLGGLEGANVSATGSLSGLGGDLAGALNATLIASDLAPLSAALADRFPENYAATELARRAMSYPDLLDDALIRISLRSDATEGAVLETGGVAGGTDFTLNTKAQSLVALALGDESLSLELRARNEDAGALYALVGLPALPLGFAGSGALELDLDGAIAEGARTRFAFFGEELELSFNGETTFRDRELSAAGSAELSAGDIEPWLTTGGVALPGMGFGLPARLATQLDLDKGLLVLSGLDGTVLGSRVAGDLNAQMRDGLPHLTGELTLQSFDLGPVAELALGVGAFDSDGEGWPTVPFSPNTVSPLTTDIQVDATLLHLGTLAAANDARFALRISKEGVSISDATAHVYGGAVSGIVDLKNDAGTGLLSAQLRLTDSQLVRLFGDVGLSGRADLTAALSASGKTVDGIVAALSGSGTAHGREIAIAGLNPHALPLLLEKADELGLDIDADATAGFATELVRRGVFTAGDADIAFTIANGAARVPPVHLETEQVALAAELRADLRAGTVGIDATLTYAPGDEAVIGSDPAVRIAASGPLAAIDVTVETTPLSQFLTQRALEIEQRRVEAMQAALLERQRHRREIRYYAALAGERQRAAEEAERVVREEEERLRLLQEEQAEAERQRLLLEQPVPEMQETTPQAPTETPNGAVGETAPEVQGSNSALPGVFSPRSLSVGEFLQGSTSGQ